LKSGISRDEVELEREAVKCDESSESKEDDKDRL